MVISCSNLYNIHLYIGIYIYLKYLYLIILIKWVLQISISQNWKVTQVTHSPKGKQVRLSHKVGITTWCNAFEFPTDHYLLLSKVHFHFLNFFGLYIILFEWMNHPLYQKTNSGYRNGVILNCTTFQYRRLRMCSTTQKSVGSADWRRELMRISRMSI